MFGNRVGRDILFLSISIDPEIDADKTEHAGIVTFGNDMTNWWAAVPALMEANLVADAMIRIVGNPKVQPR